MFPDPLEIRKLNDIVHLGDRFITIGFDTNKYGIVLQVITPNDIPSLDRAYYIVKFDNETELHTLYSNMMIKIESE